MRRGGRHMIQDCSLQYLMIIRLRIGVGRNTTGTIGIRREDRTVRRVAEDSPTLWNQREMARF